MSRLEVVDIQQLQTNRVHCNLETWQSLVSDACDAERFVVDTVTGEKHERIVDEFLEADVDGIG